MVFIPENQLRHFFWCIMLVFHIYSTSEFCSLTLYPGDSHRLNTCRVILDGKGLSDRFTDPLEHGKTQSFACYSLWFSALCLIMFYTMKNDMEVKWRKCWFWDSFVGSQDPFTWHSVHRPQDVTSYSDPTGAAAAGPCWHDNSSWLPKLPPSLPLQSKELSSCLHCGEVMLGLKWPPRALLSSACMSLLSSLICIHSSFKCIWSPTLMSSSVLFCCLQR